MWFKYLQSFIAKTQQSHTVDKTIICDVFAGTGLYGKRWSPIFTDDGSPLVALRAAIGYFERKNNLPRTFEPIPNFTVYWNLYLPSTYVAIPVEYKIDFYFVERDVNNYKCLVDNIVKFFCFHGIPCSATKASAGQACVSSTDASFPIRCYIFNCDFQMFAAPAVPYNARMVTFIDPFGFAMIPWQRVFNFVGERKELFINLMTSFMNRFFDEYPNRIGEVFGIEPLELPTSRNEDGSRVLNFVDTLVALYVEKLKTRVDYALIFEMRNMNNARLYHLIFATSHIEGVKSMKESFNRGTQAENSFSLSDYMILRRNISLTLENQQVPAHVANAIFDKFNGRSNVSINDIEMYVWLETVYVYRKTPLAILEKDGRIVNVIGRDGEQNRYRCTFPDHTEWLISFTEGW